MVEERIAKQRLNIFLIIDASTSMRGDRIGEVNQAINDIKKYLSELQVENSNVDFFLTIMPFNNKAFFYQDKDLVNVDDLQFSGIKCGGWTNLHLAYEKLGEVLHRESKGGLMPDFGGVAPIILLLTDGHPTGDAYKEELSKLQSLAWFKAALRYGIAIELNDKRTMQVLHDFVGTNGDVISVYDSSILNKIIQIIVLTASKVKSQTSDIAYKPRQTQNVVAQQLIAEALSDADSGSGEMVNMFAKSCRGYSHKNSGKPCQDSSLCYNDSKRQIIACCDGHGGNAYIRSERGSSFAAEAILNVFRKIDPRFLFKFKETEMEDTIRMELLCEWNKLVERDISKYKFSKREFAPLGEETKEELLLNRAKAYGTTMSGALLVGHTLVIASIGDSECILVRHGEIEHPLLLESDPAGNITYSLCQDDAYRYIRVKMLDFRKYDGVFLCSDGFSGPYQSYENLKKSFISPLMKSGVNGKTMIYVDNLVEELANNKGNGDDVSLAFLTKSKRRTFF